MKAAAPVLAAWMLVAPAAGAAAAGSSEPPSHALTVLEDATPSRVAPGQPVEVRLLVRNDGALTWRADAPFHLAYHLFDDLGRIVVWDGERTTLPHDVAPGATVALQARLRAPTEPGVYGLQWDLVEEMVCWAAERDPTPEPRRTLVVPALALELGFEVVRHRTPRWLIAGRRLEVPMRIRNTGRLPWSGDGSFRVVAHWHRPGGETVVWEGLRSRVTREVRPGESYELSARLEVPLGLGGWQIRWDMVEEGVRWFSSESPGPALLVPARVLPEPADPRLLAFLTVLAVLVAATVAGSRRPPGWLVSAFAVADVLWFVAALVVMQHVVLREAGATLEPGTGPLVASAVATLASPLLLLPRRLRPWALWVAATVLAALLAADVLYLRYFGELLSVAAAAGAGQTGQVLDSVAALVAPRDLWLGAHLAPALALVFLVSRFARESGRRPVAAVAVVLALAVLPGLHAVGTSLLTGFGFGAQVFSSVAAARNLGVLGYHLSDAARSVGGWARAGRLSEQEERRAAEWFRATAARRAGVGDRFGLARGANLVMIQAESMQAFVVDLEVDGQPVMPWLASHAGEWLRVPRLVDQTAQGRSSDAELATQTSLLPPPSGAASFLYPGNRFTGVAGILAERGYTTLSAVAFDGGFWNRRMVHRGFGFARSLFVEDFIPGEVIGWGLNDVDFLRQAADRLAGLEQPFCAFLITLSLHHPFARFPGHRRELELGELEGTALGNYLHTMRFLDRALGSFVDGLDARGLGDDTVVAVWGDHDAGFGADLGLAAVTADGPDPVEERLLDAVPLLLRLPGAPGSVVDVPAGHADVAPTLLALLGVDPAPFALVGRNLLGTPGDGPVLGDRGVWFDREHLFVPSGGDPGEGECWSLATRARLPEAECAPGLQAAELERWVSLTVLEHDLQTRLRTDGGTEVIGP